MAQYQQEGYPPHQQGYPPQQQGYAPQQAHHHASHYAALVAGSDAGSVGALQYLIKHRNTNSALELNIPQGEFIRSTSGAMIHMQPSVTIQAKTKFSMRKLWTSDEMTSTAYTGPGKVALTPTLSGDLVSLQIDPSSNWKVGSNAYLASTSGVEKMKKSQGLRKAFSSGESLFVYNVTGNGVIWLTSYGAIEPLTSTLSTMVTWWRGAAKYKMEKTGGGYISATRTGEGYVCRFTGPGVVYIQTRNLEEFSGWVSAHAQK